LTSDTDMRLKMHHALLALGVRSGGVVMVHSSLRALGPVEGGAETVVLALLDALGPEGTLMMPALSYSTVGADNPNFHALDTPSCVGALAEYFRTRPGTLRSIHPTHSVAAIGARARELLARHEDDTTPCGPRSPFHLLHDIGGQLLFLGCGTKPNTMMHAVEELVEPPYLFGRTITYDCIRPDGTSHPMAVRSHNFAGVAQRYDRLESLLPFPHLRVGPVLGATCHLLEAAPAWDAALAALQQDPLAFIEPA
jgi:aminoglycoside 3-N-acetyltransferase